MSYSEFLRLKQIEKELSILKLRQQPVIPGLENATSYILIANEEKTDFEVIDANWVFIPSQISGTQEMQNFRDQYQTQNAKGETILQSPVYREAALNGRCLVLSTGYYEYRHVHPIGKKGQQLKTAIKYPYRVMVKGQEYFYMAGLHNKWTDKETYEEHNTFTIITTEANELMEQVHNSKKRMPTILTEDLAYRWLLEDLDEKEIREIATFKFSAKEMEAYTVARDFRSTENIDAFEYEGLAELIN